MFELATSYMLRFSVSPDDARGVVPSTVVEAEPLALLVLTSHFMLSNGNLAEWVLQVMCDTSIGHHTFGDCASKCMCLLGRLEAESTNNCKSATPRDRIRGVAKLLRIVT